MTINYEQSQKFELLLHWYFLYFLFFLFLLFFLFTLLLLFFLCLFLLFWLLFQNFEIICILIFNSLLDHFFWGLFLLNFDLHFIFVLFFFYFLFLPRLLFWFWKRRTHLRYRWFRLFYIWKRIDTFTSFIHRLWYLKILKFLGVIIIYFLGFDNLLFWFLLCLKDKVAWAIIFIVWILLQRFFCRRTIIFLGISSILCELFELLLEWWRIIGSCFMRCYWITFKYSLYMFWIYFF